MKNHLRLFLLCILVHFSFLSYSADYYWIGGSGSWTQISNWATTSGGSTIHSSTPGSSDNVYFDASSFTTTGQTVTLDIAANCADMDWTGALYTPTLVASSNSYTLNIYGGLTAITNMTWSLTSSVYFRATTGSHDIDLNGIATLNYVYFEGAGTYNLTDSMHLNSVNFTHGTFNSANHKIYVESFNTSYSGTGTVNLGSSDIYITGYSGVYMNSSSSTINGSSARIFITRSQTSRMDFRILGNSDFGTVTSNSPLSLSGNHDSSTIDSLILNYTTTTNTSYFTSNGTINYLSVPAGGLYLASYSPYIKKAELNGFLYTSVNCTFDTLVLTSSTGAQTYTFGAGKTCTITDSIAFPVGVCATPHTIKSSSTSNATITKSSGYVIADFVIVNSITATTGGATFTANNVISEDGNSTGWTLNTLSAQDYYWVGGTGNWSDPTNWATSSGGTAQASTGCLPSASSNVYFDANSFTTTGQTATLDIAANCADMDWTGALYTPTLVASSNSYTLNIYGGLTAITNMTWSLTSSVYFRATTGSHDIDLNGISTLNYVYFEGAGTYNLTDSMHLNSVNFTHGTFNSANHKIYVESFNTSYSGTGTVNLGSSDIYITGYSGVYMNSSSSTINGSSARIFITRSQTSRMDFRILGNSDFGTVTSNSPLSLSGNHDSSTIDSLILNYTTTTNTSYFTSNGTINYLSMPAGGLYLASYSPYIKKAELNGFLYTSVNCTFDTLVLTSSTGAQTYTFGAGKTCTITDSIAFPVGVCATPHTIKSSSTSNATITKSSGYVIADFVIVNSITATTGGATFTANNVISEDGNSTGWTLNTLSAQDYYWVGGTGNWSDPTNWATSSGGTAQASTGCLPSASSNVYFDANSFTTTGQTVTLDIAANCADMDWTGATNTPTLVSSSNSYTLNIYGGLTAITNMTWSLTSSVYFRATTGSHDIDLNGIATLNYVYFEGAGTYNLTDSMHLNSVNFTHGTFNSANHKIYVESFNTSYSGTGTANLGSSDVYLTGYSGVYMNSSSSVINGSSARIFITRSQTSRMDFRILGNSDFGTVTSNSPLSLSGNHDSSTIDSLILNYTTTTNTSYFTSNGTINYLSMPAGGLYLASYSPYIKKAELNGFLYTSVNCTFDTLLLTKEGIPMTHTFGAGKTCTINDSVMLKSNGCYKAIVKSNSSSAATISMPSGKNFNTDFVDMSYITATGGGTFNAGGNSNDGGNNTGWTFTGSTYTLSLNYNYFCINPSGYSEVKVTPDGVTTKFWWRKTTTPYDTFNTNVDTVMVNSAVNYVFVAEYGTNCQTEDSVFISFQVAANGTSQSYNNSTGSEDWFDCSNWNLGFMPDTLSDVTVSSGKTVKISSDTAWCKDFTIEGQFEQTGGVLMIYGNFVNNGTILQTGGKIVFTGTSKDTISGSARIVLDSLELDKTDSLILLNVLCITDYFKFTNGILKTNNSDSLCFGIVAESNGGNSSSYIVGPVYKEGSVAFIFPTGANGVWARIGISDPASATSSVFKAQYFVALPTDTGSHTSPIVRISGSQYWQLDKVSGSSIVKVTLYFEDKSGSGIIDPTKIRIAKYDGSDWVDAGVFTYSASGLTGYFTSNDVSTFSPFTFGTTGFGNPLPVELIQFEASASAKHTADLTWETASELNNAHFVVERSYDGKDFEEAAIVQGNGTTQNVMTYEYNDNTIALTQNTVYYRLHQVDFDGTEAYSPIRRVDFDSDIIPNKVSVYPNPTTGIITVNFADDEALNHTVKVIDNLGRELYNNSFEGQAFELDISSQVTGIYFIILDSGESFKVVKE